MGIALLSIHTVCNAVGQWLNPPRATMQPNGARLTGAALRARSRISPQQWARQTASAPSSGMKLSQAAMPSTPLRVVRLSEAGATPHSAGRMRISGRMADVCAELDRLIAKEAQNLAH